MLLVAAMYSCSFGHDVSSTDPQILSKLYQDSVPFILLHKTGFLKEFVNSALELVVQGMTFAGLEKFVQKRRQQYVTCLVLQIHQQLLQQNVSLDVMACLQYDTAVKRISEPMPSNNILQQCFVFHFLENKDMYNHHMSQLPVNKFISLDHTFKVASNIGFVRSDGKWIRLYNSVFIALNEHGQVISWQFARTTSLDEVKKQLQNLCVRMRHASVVPCTILVDACCSQRQKLKQIFVEESVVSLDIFHAIQRVTQNFLNGIPSFESV